MLKFGVKVGLAGSAVYYLKEEGIWKDSQTALKTCDKINATLEPYIQQVKKQIPIELPAIPSNARNPDALRTYWNSGVIVTFAFLSELPQKSTAWACKGIRTITENPEIKKLLEKAPSPSQEPATVKK